MILLTSTSDFIGLITGGNATVTAHASWMDSSSTTVTPGREDTTVSTPTTTVLVPPPGANTQRDVKNLVITNTSSFGEQIEVGHTDGVHALSLVSLFLAAGAALMWLPRTGWSQVGGNGVRSAA